MTNAILFFAMSGCIGMMATDQIPWPEHPRPDFKREPWVNLNGPWRFAFDPQDAGVNERWFDAGSTKLDRHIVVPFPWESKLSGITDTQYKGVAWYAREVILPDGPGWRDRDAWLVIGACDFEAKVWVNGQPAGEHIGGYVPFEVNLSTFAKSGQKVALVIRAVDRTDPQQPVGKQVHWYTRTSGIWQTVYLEPRGKAYVRSIRVIPDIRTGSASFNVRIDGNAAQAMRLSSPDDAFLQVEGRVVDGQSSPRGPITAASETLRMKNPKLWSPDSPHLYAVNVELIEGDKVIDQVATYFGLREISVAKAPGRDDTYICLNGKPIYLRGALHQSFHPDGIYQYPDDAVMRSDYELCQRIGINFLRIHIKVPVPRELYWADKLGVLIMQDMPCYYHHTQQAQTWWQEMFEAAVERDFNHPAIFAWVLFNETWGIGDGTYAEDRQKWVADMYHLARRIDRTRLIEENSPCNYDHVISDINSWHFYINDYERARKHIREVVERTYPGSTFNYAKGYKQDHAPLINSEYGGIGAGSGDQDVSWCFKFLTNELRLHDKIGGYIYTELSDIEWEHNGFVDYDRSGKEFGYESWQSGFSLKDLNNPDFLAMDAPPLVELKPGETRPIPVRISHWSDRQAASLQLRYRTCWYDADGNRSENAWQSRPAAWRPFEGVDQPPIPLPADPGRGVLGVLQVELVDGDSVISRNYVNVLVDRGPSPCVESLDANTLALRFVPADFAQWTFPGEVPVNEDLAAYRVSGQKSGAIEYHLRLPDAIPLDKIESVTVTAELASKAGDEKLAWPARKNPHDYPQTDAHKWPSDVRLVVNGQEVHRTTLPDDPADATGAMSHHRGFPGFYGYIMTAQVGDAALAKVLADLKRDRTLRIRWEVPADAAPSGGLTVFGERLGSRAMNPAVRLTFKGGHGLGEHFHSDRPVTVDGIAPRLDIILPTAETGRHSWKYTTQQPDEAWIAPAFDDVLWKPGDGGFGSPETPNAIVRTAWYTPDIWLRTEFHVDNPSALQAIYWRLYHDEDVQIYLNGKKVLDRKGFITSYLTLPWEDAARKELLQGRNVLAVHCHQTGGGQNIDVGLRVLIKSAS